MAFKAMQTLSPQLGNVFNSSTNDRGNGRRQTVFSRSATLSWPPRHLGSVLDMWALIEECFVKTLEIF